MSVTQCIWYRRELTRIERDNFIAMRCSMSDFYHTVQFTILQIGSKDEDELYLLHTIFPAKFDKKTMGVLPYTIVVYNL